MNDRIRAVCQHENVNEQKARERIEQVDKERARFYNFFTSGTWGAAATYDLCINSSILGMEGSADFIKQFALKKLEGGAP